MKPISHDPLDDLIAAALHGDLTPAERAQLDSRLSNEPAARAAYQEAQLMHDLLEKTHATAQPDPNFEQRMVSGVRRKIADDQRPRETAWESLLVLWTGSIRFLRARRIIDFVAVIVILAVLAGVMVPPTGAIKRSKQNAAMMQAREAQIDEAKRDENSIVDANSDVAGNAPPPVLAKAATDESAAPPPVATEAATLAVAPASSATFATTAPLDQQVPMDELKKEQLQNEQAQGGVAGRQIDADTAMAGSAPVDKSRAEAYADAAAIPAARPAQELSAVTMAPANSMINLNERKHGQMQSNAAAASSITGNPGTTNATASDLTRKLIRNAALELEVKSFQAAMDQITALTKAAGGYVDSDNSQRGGNGKLQGSVVVKVLPENLDDFLLKLRGLGDIKNQTISTEDVTREYVDIQARLDNARRMETQLQELLKRDTGRVSDLLMVERELGRVRGEIEQMQGQLKLYDFQVEYATVTIQLSEKDLNQAAAYLLKEFDDISLFSTDVEATFQQARHAADDFKAHTLIANLNHNAPGNVSALLVVSVPPDQIEPFLAQIKSFGRIDNYSRQTKREANDGGNSDEPADETRTDVDRVLVNISIRSDDESRKQVALTVVTPTVDDALDQAKSAALAGAGTEILSSSLNKTPEGQSTAQLSVRVPGKGYRALLDAFRALGRTSSFSLQRDDNSGPGANGDDAPVILNLSLTDDETPLQQTQLAVLATDVDSQAQQLKQDAATAGVEIKASSFQREPNGIETAQMTFRLPMAKYPDFIEVLKKLGKVESLSVSRNDRPDQARTDETAPAEIDLTLHNQGDLVADNSGLWATLRQTFSEGADALFGSVRVIGVVIAFLVPWLVALVIFTWIGRRIYIAYKR